MRTNASLEFSGQDNVRIFDVHCHAKESDSKDSVVWWYVWPVAMSSVFYSRLLSTEQWPQQASRGQWPGTNQCQDIGLIKRVCRQGTLNLVLNGELSLSGLTSCPQRLRLLGISWNSACNTFFLHFQYNLVQTSKDRMSGVHYTSPSEIWRSYPDPDVDCLKH